MKHRAMDDRSTRHWRAVLAGIAAAVLIIPAIAMQFTGEVAWGPEDFGAAAVLMAAAWGMIELSWRLFPSDALRLVAASAVAIVLLAIWAHLAVGLF